jgi:hypothetical protein
MSSTAVVKGTAQQPAEQHFVNSTAKIPDQRAAAATTADAHVSDNAAINLNRAAAASIDVQTQIIEKVAATTRELTSFSQGSVEAMTQASRILATGSQDLFSQLLESTQAAYSEAISGFAALMNAKTVKERIEIQTNLVRTSTTRAIADGSRFARASFDLAEQASSPLIARAAAAAEIFPSLNA